MNTDRPKIAALEVTEAQRTSTKMLLALARTGKHVYQGTVPGAVKSRRRAASKQARVARRIGRR